METKRRARSATDKQQRRGQILDTALAMWADHSFASVSMADVATRSGLAKGTLYLYFETKEELFLAMLGRLLDAWFDDLDSGLAGVERWEASGAAELICAILERHTALTRMLPIAASILEHNISLESARAYKERLLERSTRTGALLEARLPFLGRGDGTWLLLQIYALVVGLGQMADPSPVVRQALEASEMAPLRVAFGPSIRRSLITLLQGLTIR
ncbi:MAG TPA: TetR family transcriptional regulator [Roseiflexaceae bacterium]|nr:TetR family transcriptional regulator [Roseiflexaceae bacterium]